MGNETCIRSILCALNLFSAFFCIHKIARFNFHCAGKDGEHWEENEKIGGWLRGRTENEEDTKRVRNGEGEEESEKEEEQPKTRYDPACIQFNMPDFNLDIYLCIIFRQWTRSEREKTPKLKLSKRVRENWMHELKNAYRVATMSRDEEKKKYSGTAYELWCSKSIESQI